MRNWLPVLMALLIVVLVNNAIYQKEQHIREADEVLLALAPVDPRSLMQGDYMALRFEIAAEVMAELKAGNGGVKPRTADGHVVVKLDAKNVGRYVQLGIIAAMPEVSEAQLALRYRVRNSRLRFATNAFFFQEGKAKHYEKATFGVFRVASDGELLLVDLADSNYVRLSINDGGGSFE